MDSDPLVKHVRMPLIVNLATKTPKQIENAVKSTMLKIERQYALETMSITRQINSGFMLDAKKDVHPNRDCISVFGIT